MKTLPADKVVSVEEELHVLHTLIDDLLPNTLELIVSADGVAELVDAIRGGLSIEDAQKLVEKKKRQIVEARRKIRSLRRDEVME